MQRLALAVALFVAMWPLPALAQPSCRFVLGFAELAAQLGDSIVGACVENQRTITGQGEQAEAIDASASVAVSPGDAVQRTSRGIMTWSPKHGNVYFFTNAAAYRLGAGTSPVSTRPTSSAPGPGPTTSEALGDARSTCGRAANDWMITTLGASEAVQRRAEAEANAKGYLCEQALERHGPKGVECYVQAWDAARGMEQMFAGTGRQTYDDVYARCIVAR